MRPKSGGIAVTLGSENVERPWHMRAAMTPGQRAGPPHHRRRGTESLGQGSHARHARGREPVRARSAAVGAHPRRYRARRHSAHARRQDPGGQGRHHRSRRSARPHSDRSRRNQSRLGRDAPGAGHAVPGGVGRQSHHPAGAVRRAARRKQRVGPPGLRRHGRAGLRRAGGSECRSSSTASRCGCGSTPPSSASTSIRANWATPILVSRSPAASTFPATIRAWCSALRARACRSRR